MKNCFKRGTQPTLVGNLWRLPRVVPSRRRRPRRPIGDLGVATFAKFLEANQNPG